MTASSSSSGVFRYIPEYYLSGSYRDSVEAELRQAIFSLKGGLRPVRTRVEALSKLSAMIRTELNKAVNTSSPLLSESTRETDRIAKEVGSLSVCCSNAIRFLRGGPNKYVHTVFRLIRLYTRRSRLFRTFELVENLAEIQGMVSNVTKANAAETISRFRERISSIEGDVVAISCFHETLASKISDMRKELMLTLCRICCEGVSESDCESELSDSLLSNDAAFWYCSKEGEELLLVQAFTRAFLRDHFARIVAMENWEPRTVPGSGSGETMLEVFAKLKRISGSVQVLSQENVLVEQIICSIGKIYWLYVFMSFCGSDLASILYSGGEGEDLETVHASWLRTSNLQVTIRTIQDPFMYEEAMLGVNKIKRHVSQQMRPIHYMIAAESVRMVYSSILENRESLLLITELDFSIYSTLAENGLAHAFNRWTENIITSDDLEFDLANEILVAQVSSFLQVFQQSPVVASCAESVIIKEVLNLISEAARIEPVHDYHHDEENRQLIPSTLVELARDLQAKLTSVGFPVKTSEWTLVYECIQMLSMPDGAAVLPWATEQTLKVPLRVLTAVIAFCEQDEETLIELIEALEHQVINLCS